MKRFTQTLHEYSQSYILVNIWISFQMMTTVVIIRAQFTLEVHDPMTRLLPSDCEERNYNVLMKSNNNYQISLIANNSLDKKQKL